VGVNGLYLVPGGVGGTEIYLQSLAAALAESPGEHEFVVFFGKDASNAFPLSSRMQVVSVPIDAGNRPRRLLFEQAQLPDLCDQHRIEVLLNPGFTGPFRPRRPMVTVIHDLQFRDHPEYFARTDLAGWRFFVGGTIARSSRLIAISEWTKRQLLTHYPLTAGRVDVAPNGVEDALLGSEWKPYTDDRYLLTISTLHPHKNLDTLLRAYSVFRRRHPNIRLVIAGLKGNAAQDLAKLRQSLDLESTVEFTYWIPREHLHHLLFGAWAFVFPSRYEGFGIPVAEALALGIPTVCSDIPVLDEVAGDAALRFPRDSVEDLANALERVVSDEDLRAELSRRGPLQTQRFRWSESAAATIRSLEAAVHSSPASSAKT
jgi:glycosyltransferase involved in cell wall biosynthesis